MFTTEDPVKELVRNREIDYFCIIVCIAVVKRRAGATLGTRLEREMSNGRGTTKRKMKTTKHKTAKGISLKILQYIYLWSQNQAFVESLILQCQF